MLTVTARPRLSPGMSFTSIVPALSGRKTDRVMLRFAQIPETERAPQLDVAGEHVQRRHGIHEVARDELVPREVGVDAVRIELSVSRQHGRVFGDEVQVLVEFHQAPARSARSPTPCW